MQTHVFGDINPKHTERQRQTSKVPLDAWVDGWKWRCITSFYRTFGCPIIYTDSIHNAIVVIDTSNNAWHSQVHWLVGTPYLAIKASNGVDFQVSQCIPIDLDAWVDADAAAAAPARCGYTLMFHMERNLKHYVNIIFCLSLDKTQSLLIPINANRSVNSICNGAICSFSSSNFKHVWFFLYFFSL